MRQKILLFTVGFLWGITLTFIGGVIFLRTSLIKVDEIDCEFKNVAKKMSESVKQNGAWTVTPIPCSLPKTDRGEKTEAFLLCNREYAEELLSAPGGRKTAALLPCHVALYDAGNGKTVAARLNMSLVSLLLGGKAARLFPERILPEQQEILNRMK